MKLGVRLKLFFASFAVIAISVTIGDAYLAHGIDRYLTANIEQDLFVRAKLVALKSSEVGAPSEDVATWDQLADRLGAAAQARVTLVASDGRVLGDSEVDAAKIATLENHAGREEIDGALSSGQGSSNRLSATVRERMMYVAIPFTSPADGRVMGVARVAKPLRAVDDAIGAVHRIVFIAVLIALMLALFLSSAAAQRMSAVVRSLTETARRMKSGDLDVRTHVTGTDELAELGRALDQLAGSLENTLAELRTERDLQRRILEGMHEGVLVLDAEARVVTMNHALREMLLLPADAVGKLLLEVIRHAELHMLLEMARADGQSSGELELPGIKPRRLLVGATALHDEGDEGIIAVIVDVTDVRRLESLRRDFVANVSHELRTPVAAVRSAAETLRTSVVSDPNAALRFVDMIERNAQRLQSLIEDLLELSRIESKEFRLKRERVDIAGVFNIVVGLFRERAERKQIRLDMRIVPPSPQLQSDQRALEQILSNLVENAVKYCPAGSSVTLSAETKGDFVRLAVEDTGPGIDEKHLPRLFERFYRVDAGRSREVGGTGLGLSIVKHLSEALGGKVSVESRLGQGSTFIVVLRA
ncbi:ATP-binding protein [Pendulispora albinea]|uniref:histidine kinase n=1 Tax=Pendulispora albinea TaxID=2741071 RepID=A0ABZ2M2H3_9BACT